MASTSPLSTPATSVAVDSSLIELDGLFIRPQVDLEQATLDECRQTVIPKLHEVISKLPVVYGNIYSIQINMAGLTPTSQKPAIVIYATSKKMKKTIGRCLSKLSWLPQALTLLGLDRHVINAPLIGYALETDADDLACKESIIMEIVVDASSVVGSRITTCGATGSRNTCVAGVTWAVGGQARIPTALHAIEPRSKNFDVDIDERAYSAIDDDNSEYDNSKADTKHEDDDTGDDDDDGCPYSWFCPSTEDKVRPSSDVAEVQVRRLHDVNLGYMSDLELGPELLPAERKAKSTASISVPLYADAKGPARDWSTFSCGTDELSFLDSMMGNNIIDGHCITEVGCADVDRATLITAALPEGEISGYLHPGQVQLYFDGQMFELFLVVLDEIVGPGCSGASVACRNELLGTILFGNPGTSWVYMMSAKAIQQDIEAVTGLPVRLPQQQEVTLEVKPRVISYDASRNPETSTNDAKIPQTRSCLPRTTKVSEKVFTPGIADLLAKIGFGVPSLLPIPMRDPADREVEAGVDKVESWLQTSIDAGLISQRSAEYLERDHASGQAIAISIRGHPHRTQAAPISMETKLLSSLKHPLNQPQHTEDRTLNASEYSPPASLCGEFDAIFSPRRRLAPSSDRARRSRHEAGAFDLDDSHGRYQRHRSTERSSVRSAPSISLFGKLWGRPTKRLTHHGARTETQRDPGHLDDTFQEKLLFHRTGKSMDEHGHLSWNNASLPPEIPRHDSACSVLQEQIRQDTQSRTENHRRLTTFVQPDPSAPHELSSSASTPAGLGSNSSESLPPTGLKTSLDAKIVSYAAQLTGMWMPLRATPPPLSTEATVSFRVLADTGSTCNLVSRDVVDRMNISLSWDSPWTSQTAQRLEMTPSHTLAPEPLDCKLSELLRKYSSSQCSEPRDKIYARISVASDNHAMSTPSRKILDSHEMLHTPAYPPTREDWNTYKPAIVQRYMSMPLPKLMYHIEEHYGFYATCRMYKQRLAEWGVAKYQQARNRRATGLKIASTASDSMLTKQVVQVLEVPVEIFVSPLYGLLQDSLKNRQRDSEQCSLETGQVLELPVTRLLRLCPDVHDDGFLLGDISVTQLDPDWKPYTALSHAWGTANECGSVKLNSRRCAVPLNLYHALHSLSKREEAGHLWIDAICINQDSQAQKLGQMKMMRETHDRLETASTIAERSWFNGLWTMQEVVTKMLNAVEKLHAMTTDFRGTHVDLKPENILVFDHIGPTTRRKRDSQDFGMSKFAKLSTRPITSPSRPDVSSARIPQSRHAGDPRQRLLELQYLDVIHAVLRRKRTSDIPVKSCTQPRTVKIAHRVLEKEMWTCPDPNCNGKDGFKRIGAYKNHIATKHQSSATYPESTGLSPTSLTCPRPSAAAPFDMAFRHEASTTVVREAPRDPQKHVCKYGTQRDPRQSVQQVPEIWALVINMYIVISCAPFSVEDLRSADIKLRQNKYLEISEWLDCINRGSNDLG